MKKVLRLTESELIGLIENIVYEQTNTPKLKVNNGDIIINGIRYELMVKMPFGVNQKSEIKIATLNRDGSIFIKACIGICKEDTLPKEEVDKIIKKVSDGAKKIPVKNKKGEYDKFLKLVN